MAISTRRSSRKIEESETATEVAGFSDDEHRVWIYYATDRYKLVACARHDEARRRLAFRSATKSHADASWQACSYVLGTVKE